MGSAKINDRDLEAAIFLWQHPQFKPEDLGYPRGDYILLDLIKLLSHHAAAAAKARST